MSFFEMFRKHHEKNKERAKGFGFLKAAMAACAVVAVADGDSSKREGRKVKDMLNILEKLKMYDTEEAYKLYSRFVSKLESRPDKGREEAMKAIAEGAPDDELKRLVIMLCKTVAEADGKVLEEEEQSIAAIADVIGYDKNTVGGMARTNSN
ncbi:MAG: TerB family tellurite resistance protein [Magnetovibrionaceae bacterium]